MADCDRDSAISTEECKSSCGGDTVVEIFNACFVHVGRGFELVVIVDEVGVIEDDVITKLAMETRTGVVAVYVCVWYVQ